MRRLVPFLLLLFQSLLMAAQSAPGSLRLAIPVEFVVVNGDYSQAIIYMRKGGETVGTFKGMKNMKVKLDYNSDYRLDFTKPGYITKSIHINTTVAEERRKMGFDPYKIGVRLFKQYEGVNIVVYNQPVAFIRYLAEMDEIGYDTDYTKSILSELKATEEILEQKAKQEREMMKLAAAKKREPSLKSGAVESLSPEKKKVEISAVVPPEEKPATTVEIPEVPAPLLAPSTPIAQPQSASSRSGTPSDGDDPVGRAGHVQGADVPPNGDGAGDAEKGPADGLHSGSKDLQPVHEQVATETGRTVERIVEANRVITITQIREGNNMKEYRAVNYNWGGQFFFMNNTFPISEHLFEFLTTPHPSR